MFRCSDPGMSLEADEQMITSVMLNLIRNAFQALEGKPGAEVIVEAETVEKERVALSVTDNGPGVPPEFTDEIFMPFFTTRTGGTGVGLSYSRQVMNLHRGYIAFESVPGRTQFRLIF